MLLRSLLTFLLHQFRRITMLHNCMEIFTNLHLSAFIREKAHTCIRFSKGVYNPHKNQSSLISSGGNSDWVGLPWHQLSNFSRCTCIFRKWFKWTEQASVQTVWLIPFHNIGFASLKFKVLVLRVGTVTLAKAASTLLNNSGVTYQNQLSWHSSVRPIAHSLVSGLDEQPYAYDSNPRQTESAERAAELPSLQPIRYRRKYTKNIWDIYIASFSFTINRNITE